MSDPHVADGETAPGEGERHAVPGFGPRPDGAVSSGPAGPKPPEHTVRNLVLVLGGIVLVAIVVCVVLAWLFLSVVGGAVDDVESNRNETAITLAEYRSVEAGMTETEVREMLGQPHEQTAADESSPGESGARTCLYYNEMDAGLVAGDRFSFCFVGDRLASKSRD